MHSLGKTNSTSSSTAIAVPSSTALYHPADDVEITQPRRHQLAIIMGSLFFSLLLVSLDQSIVATVLPVIASHFDALGEIEWVGTAYILPMTALQLLFGKLADTFGRKRTLINAIIIFLVGSTLSGAAQSTLMLFIMRGVQGIGAAGIAPLVMIIIGDIVPLRERGKYQSIVALCWATGSIAGPLVGGVLADHLNWRWIFYINLPIGIMSALLLWLFLHIPRDKNDQTNQALSWRAKCYNIDIPGAIVFIASIFCFLLATQWGGRWYPWKHPIILGLYGASLVLVALVIVSSWWHLTSPNPILPIHLFLDFNRVAIFAMVIATSAAMFINVFYLPIYFQVAHGDTPTMAGFEVLPYLLPVDIVSMISGFIVSKTGYYRHMFWVGTALIAIGGGLQTLLDVDSNNATQVGFLILTGAGAGFCIQNVYVAAQASTIQEEIASAISLVCFFGYLGFVSGISIGGAIFNNTLTYYLRHRTALSEHQIREAQKSPELLKRLEPGLRKSVAAAYGSSLQWTFLAVAICGCLGFLFSLFLSSKKIQQDDTRQALSSSPLHRSSSSSSYDACSTTSTTSQSPT